MVPTLESAPEPPHTAGSEDGARQRGGSVGTGPWLVDLISRSISLGRYRRSARRQLQELFLHLAQEEESLDAMAVATEERFLAAGQAIQALCVLSEQLVQTSSKLTCGSGGKGNEVLESAVELIRQQVGFVQHCQGANAGLIARLEAYSEQVHALEKCDEALSRILSPMETVSILYKIQAVSLEGDEKVFFAALTEDIAALQKSARASFNEHFERLIHTQRGLHTSLPGLKQRSQKLGAKLAEAGRRMEETLAAFQGQLDERCLRQTRLQEVGKAVAEATGRAVIGLQFQDITRQKWEHVAMAIGQMRERCASATAARWHLPQESICYLRDSSRLQARQLQAIEDDLTQAQNAVSESLHLMLAHLQEIDAECQRLCGAAGGSAAVDNMVRALVGVLGEAQAWMAEISELTQATTHAVSALDKTASNVAGILRRLSIDIGLIAINAQVQAAHVRTHSGLAILSENTFAAAKEIQVFSATQGAHFDTLVSELTEIVAGCQKLSEEAQSGQQWLNQEGQNLKGNLAAYRDKVVGQLKEVSASMLQLHDQADGALQTVDFHDSFKDGFAQLRATLSECSSLAEKFLDFRGAAVNAAKELEALKASYTMESERVVHDEALGQSIEAANATATRPGLVPVVDASVLAHKDQPAEPARAADSPSAPPESKKAEFGDNVELF